MGLKPVKAPHRYRSNGAACAASSWHAAASSAKAVEGFAGFVQEAQPVSSSPKLRPSSAPQPPHLGT